jgi:hypothetical protein
MLDAYTALRNSRTERAVNDMWSLSVVPRGTDFDVAVLKNGRYVCDNDSPIGGPWTFCTAEGVDEIEANLRRAVEQQPRIQPDRE